MSTYKQILTDLGLIFYNHNQIMSFGYGHLSQLTTDIDTKVEPLYVRSYVVPGSTIFNDNIIQYNFSIIVCDKVEEDLSNQLDILSDTLEICKDIFTVLYNSYGDEFGNFTEYYEPEFGTDIIPFLERFETVLAGWTLNISINVPFNYDQCVLPIDTLELPTDIYNTSYKQIVHDILHIGDQHKQLNSTGFGDLSQSTLDNNTKVSPLYPKLYITPDRTIFNNSIINHNFNIIVMDRLKLDYTNQRDVMSDTLNIMRDVFIVMKNSEYYSNYGVVCNPFLERFDDVLSGWSMNINIEQPYRYNRCDIPLNTFDKKLWYQIDQLWNQISKLWKDV